MIDRLKPFRIIPSIFVQNHHKKPYFQAYDCQLFYIRAELTYCKGIKAILHFMSDGSYTFTFMLQTWYQLSRIPN